MKYVKFSGETGYRGCGFDLFAEFEDNTSEQFLNQYLKEVSYKNAKECVYVVTGDWGNDFENEEEEEEYYENAESNGSWEYITKEEYEGSF